MNTENGIIIELYFENVSDKERIFDNFIDLLKNGTNIDIKLKTGQELKNSILKIKSYNYNSNL